MIIPCGNSSTIFESQVRVVPGNNPLFELHSRTNQMQDYRPQDYLVISEMVLEAESTKKDYIRAEGDFHKEI